MRRITTLFTALVMVLAMTAGTALAMQPPGEPAQDTFGCVDGSPILGHPGAAGLVGASANSPDAKPHSPTAWSAVDRAGPIVSSCP